MPLKLGNGGHGLEEYNEHDGKYKTDGIPNKSYNNPEEESFFETLGLNNDVDNYIENAVGSSTEKENHKTLVKEMLNKIPDSQYKEVLINWLKNCPSGSIQFLNIAISECNNFTGKIKFEYDVLSKKDLKTFTHEIGHSIDFMHRGNRIDFMSVYFKNKEGKTIEECLFLDWDKNGNKLLNDYKQFEASCLKEEFKKNGLEYKTKFEQELDFEKSKKLKLNQIQDNIDKIKNEFQIYAKNKTKEEILQDKYALELNEKFIKLREKQKETIKEEFSIKELSEKELQLKIKVLKEKIQPVYTNLSDAVSSMNQTSYGLCGAGHPANYWYRDSGNIPTEFFANCFNSLVTNNEQEIKLYEQYFPNAFNTVKESLQEIFNKIKGEYLYGKLGI